MSYLQSFVRLWFEIYECATIKESSDAMLRGQSDSPLLRE